MMLARLAADAQPVKVHLEMAAHMEPDADSGNVIGEIPGREHPEEVVVIGGHLDSFWRLRCCSMRGHGKMVH